MRRCAGECGRAAGAPACRGSQRERRRGEHAEGDAPEHESRGLRCVEVDLAVLRGERQPELTLFA
jgi:hypothetical protein